jgi:hypothetical protein
MNWTKKQTQWYGAFMAILGIALGISGTMMVLAILN